MPFGLQSVLDEPELSRAANPDDQAIIAAGDGDLETVRSLLPTLGINHCDVNGYTATHAAVSYNQLQVLQWLLESGADVNVRDIDGDTPLHHCELADVAAYLVSRGANHQVKNSEGKTALEAKLEEVMDESSEDYDPEDEEQRNLGALISYLQTLPLIDNANDQGTTEMAM